MLVAKSVSACVTQTMILDLISQFEPVRSSYVSTIHQPVTVSSFSHI